MQLKSIKRRQISITQIEEGQYSEVKSIAIRPAKLTHTISAFANTDGGDLYIGITEQMLGGNVKKRGWNGFPDVEAANGHMQAFEKHFPLGKDFQYEFLRCIEPSRSDAARTGKPHARNY